MDGADVTTQEPGERDVAMVFQSYALYPHMTVAQNIGFPLKMVGTAKGEIAQRGAPMPPPRSHRPPAAAHAGPAVGRPAAALRAGARDRAPAALFLLDEPLSNLDAKLRLETRLELRKLQRALGATTVYVTHDQEEAMTLADRIAVFMDGRIVQVGTPRGSLRAARKRRGGRLHRHAADEPDPGTRQPWRRAGRRERGADGAQWRCGWRRDARRPSRCRASRARRLAGPGVSHRGPGRHDDHRHRGRRTPGQDANGSPARRARGRRRADRVRAGVDPPVRAESGARR